MKIVGFNFTKILAEREGPAEGKVNISMTLDIDSMTKESLQAISQTVVKSDFNFLVKYEKMAKLEFKGSIYFTAEDEKIKEIMKKWKDKKVPDDIRVPLYNLILTKSNIRALELEDEFGLPTHIPMPKMSPNPNPQETKDTKNTKEASYVK